jgi:hypothetical protein
MAVFVSYSSRDRALLDGLLGALRRAHEQVWLDEELGGGEAWWRAILEQIRGCDVFVVALSKNMLESKACQAELRYAQDLGKSILPVQVGPLDNMRINPLAQMQVIDYRDPSIETGIELVSSVHARRAVSPPLPDPLPEEPPIPFAYLMRLASTISGPSLSAQQQMTLVAELKAGLEEDGDDLSARRDITQLLCMLRDRSDVTWRTRTEVEAVLTSLESAGPSSATGPPQPTSATGPGPSSVTGPGPTSGTGPQPVYTTGPQPRYQPPPGGPPPGFNQHGTQPPSGPPGFGFGAVGPGGAGEAGKSRTKWLIAGGGVAAAVIIAVVVVVIVAVSGNNPGTTPTPPSPPPTVEPAALNSVLLTPHEIESIVGATKLTSTEVMDHMDDFSLTMSNPDCSGILGTAIKSVYAGSGYTYVRDQAFTLEDPLFFIAQTAVLFPSVDHARKFISTSVDKWKRCGGQTVSVATEDGEVRWTVAELAESDSQIAQLATKEAAGGYACQHVVRVVSNVVIEAAACHDDISDEANRIAEKMAANVPA